ncbi:hypothetical protein [Achromobacter sp.]|uniref:hypothetical protein n=1 Tax=Achromobacter sp. TaxID=134375 RepID=UPI000EECF57A|nr:hypothetical protein [Achromobacter sp.]HCW20980.1 hypothetical protein [Achromobacter sp.]
MQHLPDAALTTAHQASQHNALPVNRGLQYQCRIVEHGALRQIQRHLRMLAPLLHPLLHPLRG